VKIKLLWGNSRLETNLGMLLVLKDRVQSEPGKPGKGANFQKSQGACLKICTGQRKVFYDCKKGPSDCRNYTISK